jgi:hypothetical protein
VSNIEIERVKRKSVRAEMRWGVCVLEAPGGHLRSASQG